MSTPPPSPHPRAPKLPSRGVSATLAALMLAAGIAAGALIGPGPAASLASTSRAAAVGRVLALLALSDGAGGSSGLLLSSGAGHTSSTPPSPPAPATASNAAAGAGSGQGAAGGGAGSGAASSSSSPPSTPSSSPKSGASEGSASPTRSPTPAAGGGEGETTKATTPLPPVAHVWLIVLPYGTSVTNALGQSAAAPYLDGQLAGQGTILSAYTSLAAGQLAGAATLLSGQEAAGVSTISPPPCTPAATPGGTSPGTTTPGQGTTADGPAGTPCPSGEPAGVAAANAFVAEVVPRIVASATYKEHGLIVITFATATGAASTPSTGTPSTEGADAEAPYPAGTLTTTLTAAGAPAGALVLSPFLRHPGKRVASAFAPQAPRTSLEGLLQTKAAGA
jgi:hypothetical protein